MDLQYIPLTIVLCVQWPFCLSRMNASSSKLLVEAVINVGWSSVVVDYERNNIFYINSFAYFLLITIVSVTFNSLCVYLFRDYTHINIAAISIQIKQNATYLAVYAVECFDINTCSFDCST